MTAARRVEGHGPTEPELPAKPRAAACPSAPRPSEPQVHSGLESAGTQELSAALRMRLDESESSASSGILRVVPQQSLSILYAGCLGASARSLLLFRTLGQLGHRVDAVPTDLLDARGEKLVPRDLYSRLRHRLRYPRDLAKLNAGILRRLEEQSYDILWVSKALMLRASTLRRARELRPSMRLAFFSEDDMVAPHNRSRHFDAGLPLYDIVFTTKSYNADDHELPAQGARRVVMVDKSYDEARHRPLAASQVDRQRFGSRVGFIGTYEEPRAAALLALAEAGIEVRVFGNHWPKSWHTRHPKLRIEGQPLLGDDYVRGLCATDINLGFLRKANRDLQTDRSVEIPACGAFLLAERTDEHCRLFAEGREAAYFDSHAELIEKTRLYLDDPTARLRIAAAGRRRCLTAGYSFQARLPRQLVQVMECER